MARGIHLLSAKQVEHAKKPLSDGGNLWIYPQGSSKPWFFRYTINGRARQMGLGSYPHKSLEKARAEADYYRKLLKSGIDPLEHRKAEALRKEFEAAKALTFTQCAARYILSHRHGWNNRKHAHQWVSTLKTYARPKIGSMPIAEVDTDAVLGILRPIWKTKTETAKRVQGRVENILDWATAREYRTGNNPARWRGHLSQLLPRPTRVRTVRHHPAMPYAEVPAFMAELVKDRGVAALALRFLVLTASRTSETLRAQWPEIDIVDRVWTIPAHRMKSRREHRVPLSGDAVAVLEALPRREGSPYVFPGARHGRPLSDMSLLQLMRRMGYGGESPRGPCVPHGFRSSFRDWSGEVSSFPRDVAEMALAHVIQNKAEAAYRRGDLFDKRRDMMEEWADWCRQAGSGKPEPRVKTRRP